MFSKNYEAITDFNQVENEDISDNEDQIFLDENGAELEILDQRETESGVQIAVNYKGETVWVMKRKKGEFCSPRPFRVASFERYGDAVYEAPNLASDKEDLYGLTRSGDKEDELLHDDKGRLYSEGGQYLMSGGLPFIGEGVNPEIDDDYDKRLGYWSSDEDSEEGSRDEGDDDSGDSNDDQAVNDDDVGEGSGDENGGAVGQEIDPSLETLGLRHLVPSTDDARKSSAPEKNVSQPSKIASPAGMEEEKSETTASETKIPAPAVFGPSSTASNSSTFPGFDVGNQINKPAFANQKTLPLAEAAAVPATQHAKGFNFSEAFLSSGRAKAVPRQARSHIPGKEVLNESGINNSPASNFGSHIIQPAFTNSKSMSLAKAAAAPHAQYIGGFKFSEDIPSSGQTKAECKQTGHGIGDDDIPRFDDKARADDLKEFAPTFDRAKIQDNSSTKADESESQTDRNGGQAQIKSPIPPKAYSLPQSNSFDSGSNLSRLSATNIQMPSSAETASENNAKSRAGFSFSVDFVSKTHR